MENDSTVCIMLAVHNGSAYIGEQLQSIFAQTYKDWILYISDDHSTDNSFEICREFAENSEGKIHMMHLSSEQNGAKENFAYLFSQVCNCKYYTFCDQDDIWITQKIEILVRKIKFLEGETGYNFPLLVYSDLEVVDAELKTLHPSFIKTSKLKLPDKNLMQQFLLYNCIPGCSMLFNYELKQKTERIPEIAYMHDWWVALVAASIGKISLCEETLVKYRQHSSNAVGTIQHKSICKLIKDNASNSQIKTMRINNQNMKVLRKAQAEEFLTSYGYLLDDNQILVLRCFIHILSNKSFFNPITAFKNGFVFKTRLYTIKFFIV